jgi:hypothetical protein
MCKDPHLSFAYGGGADFRGVPGQLYAFVSSPRTVVNVRIADSLYKLRGATVNGTFISAVHVASLTREDRWFNVSVLASRLNDRLFAWDFVNGTCGHAPFVLGPHGRRACDDLEAEMDYSSLKLRLTDWEVDAMGQPVYDWLAGAKHRLDLGIAFLTEYYQARPHGLVGQSFDGSYLPRRGRTDRYPTSGNFTTSAMAQGAIDGAEADYRVATPYATAFRYSAMPKPRPLHRRRRRLQNSASGDPKDSICCQTCISKRWKYCVIPDPDGASYQKLELTNRLSYQLSAESAFWSEVANCHGGDPDPSSVYHNGTACNHTVHHTHGNGTISNGG